jgi:colicin import membrane protein
MATPVAQEAELTVTAQEGATAEVAAPAQAGAAAALPVEAQAGAGEEDVRRNRRPRFRYGWRYKRRRLPDGRVEYKQVPLTLLDVLHPRLGDHVTQGEEHIDWCIYLKNVFSSQLAAVPDVIVVQDLSIVWDNPALRNHGPDIAVIFGAEKKGTRNEFKVAEEGVRPILILEVTSDSTRRVDLNEKRLHYALAGVPFYYIVDRGTPARPSLTLKGYRLSPSEPEYEPLVPDERGWFWLEPLELWLGKVGDRQIGCYDQAGNLIEDYQGLRDSRLAEVAARAEAEALAEAEAKARAEAEMRAEQAEAKLQALEAELRRLRGEA